MELFICLYIWRSFYNKFPGFVHRYADDLEYKEFSRREIDERTKNLNSLSDWVNLLFEYLHYERQLPETVAATLLEG